MVQEGQAAFERAFDRVYNGRICSFGEVVLAFVKTAKKGAPSWRKGVWLTKSNTSDVHVVGIGEHIVCARSVRRLPKQWDLKLAGDVVAEPWCFGLASLGSKLVSTLPYLFGLFLGDPSYHLYSPKHFGSRWHFLLAYFIFLSCFRSAFQLTVT